MLVINMESFEKLLLKAPDVTEVIQERERLQNVFDNKILPAANMLDVDSVALDDMISVLEDVDGYCGMEFPDEREVSELSGLLWKIEHAKEKKIFRVL